MLILMEEEVEEQSNGTESSGSLPPCNPAMQSVEPQIHLLGRRLRIKLIQSDLSIDSASVVPLWLEIASDARLSQNSGSSLQFFTCFFPSRLTFTPPRGISLKISSSILSQATHRTRSHNRSTSSSLRWKYILIPVSVSRTPFVSDSRKGSLTQVLYYSLREYRAQKYRTQKRLLLVSCLRATLESRLK